MYFGDRAVTRSFQILQVPSHVSNNGLECRISTFALRIAQFRLAFYGWLRIGTVGLKEEYDFVIVGAGSAGSALAARLTQDGRYTVLVLEAGGDDRRFFIQMPVGYGKVFHDARVNWKYQTAPVPGLNDKPSYWPRGKVLGGSSSINAMVYVRGHPRDFDNWGVPGWDWRSVAPIFRRMEDWEGGGDQVRGKDGPLHVTDTTGHVHPLCDAYLNATGEAGIKRAGDYNGVDMEGAALYQITTKDGLRASAARAYLRPAMKRANLNVVTHAHVERVEMAHGRATGVRYRRGGRALVAKARREVILCGGAVNSPQLLQLSGIGPGAVLAGQGIDVRHDAPEVGRNLADHLGYDHLYRSRVPTLNQVLRPWHGKLRVGLDFLVRRQGPLTLSLNQAGGFVTLNDTGDGPDIQLYFSPLSYTRAPVGTRPLMSPDPFPGFLFGFNPCRPTSRGYIEIASPDPFVPPEIQPSYLDTEYDRRIMIDGVRLMRRIAGMPALAAVIEERIEPPDTCESDDDILAHVRDNAWTVFHACGTCRMGTDVASVLDERLRVRGVGGLRVVDASVFPAIPTGNTNAPAIMVGERASDLILEDAREGVAA